MTSTASTYYSEREWNPSTVATGHWSNFTEPLTLKVVGAFHDIGIGLIDFIRNFFFTNAIIFA